MLLALYLDGGGVLHLRVDARLGGIVHPLPHEYLVLLGEEVRPLAFPLVVDPVPLEVVTASFGHDPVAASLAHVPHPLVDVAVRVYHAALPMGQVVHPHPVVPVASLVEHGPSPLLDVALPVARVLPSEFVLGVGHPESPLSVAFVLAPAALILVPVGVVLNTETVLLVVLPVSDVLVGPDPLVGFLGAVLVEGLFLRGGRGTFTQ